MNNSVTRFPGSKSGGHRHGDAIDDGVLEISMESIEHALREAIAREEFYLRYQPKISVKTGEVCGVEALLRWNSAEVGHVNPDIFIQVAEESNLIYDIGAWVLDEACRQVTEWAQLGIDISLAINISQAQFKDPEFISKFEAAFAKYPESRGRLEIEITETALMVDVDQAIRLCRQIVTMDVEISIDDFGTGYSCLAQLTRLPVSKIKIDRSFVQNLENADGSTIVRSILSMAHDLNKSVVAEGVETAGQLRFLSLHNCDEVQGFLFSQAVSAKDVTTFVQMKMNHVGVNEVGA